VIVAETQLVNDDKPWVWCCQHMRAV